MIRLLSLFSGIGAFETALKRLDIPFETVAYCEIDKYASKAYSMLHNISEDFNLHDVRTADVSNIRDVDLLTYGFPCQDISLSGLQKGFYDNDGNKTRSGLFFDALRVIETVKPKYAIAENVKALTSKKFKNEFDSVLNGLSDAGYNNYWSVLNAKDYEIPQNRERVFIVSARKDIDCNGFVFPDKIPLNLRMTDFLEPTVDKKFYINTENASRLLDSLNHSHVSAKDPTVMQVGNIVNTVNFDNPQCGRVYDPDGLCPTLNTMQGGGREPKIIESVCAASRGRSPGDRTPGNNTVQQLEINWDGVCNTLTTVQKDNYVMEAEKDGTARTIKSQYYKTSVANMLRTGSQGATGVMAKFSDTDWKIRKLTPRESWRLMGFTDSEFDSVKGISNTQLYKQAGNSIVVTVLEAIFKQLFKDSSK